MKPKLSLRRKSVILMPVAALLAAALACNSPNPTVVALTPQVATGTPAPTPAPTQPAKATATQPLVLPATATGTAPPAASPAATLEGDCGNVYLPVAEGVTWTYVSTSTVSSSTGGRTVTTTKVGKDSFFHEVQMKTIPIHYEVSWTCTPQGLVELGGGVLASLNANPKVKIDILDNKGMTLPSIINIGDTWTQTTEIRMTSESLNGTGRWISNYMAIGPEEVTVPAGTFDTMRIDGTLQSISDPYPSMNSDVLASAWYAPQVGLVKTTGHISGESANYDYELDLVSYKIP